MRTFFVCVFFTPFEGCDYILFKDSPPQSIIFNANLISTVQYIIYTSARPFFGCVAIVCYRVFYYIVFLFFTQCIIQ